jgi:ABC-2 type transport system permease protein
VALASFGFMFGALANEVADPDGISDQRIEMFGGSLDTVIDGFLGIVTLMIASLAAVVTVLGVQAMRSEETGGRAEPILATATSRWAWAGGHVAVLALGVTALLAVAGFASGVGAWIAVGNGTYVAALTVAHLAHAPGVLVLLGLATLLYGVAPRAIGATWLLLGLGLFSGLFGPMVDLPQWLRNLTPTEYVGNPPLDEVSVGATFALATVAVTLAALGLTAFRRRDLESK